MFAADFLCQADEKSVVFVEEPGISWQIIRKKALVGSVGIIAWSQADAADDTASICINNENRLFSGIQYYGISSLRSNAVNGE